MTVQTHSGPTAALRGAWQRNQDLLRNAGSLAGTTGMTSIFGFVYWLVAAREFSQQAVGYGSAAVSAMTLLGTIGMFGLGTMMIGELPKRTDRGGLVSASLIASGVGSLILGLSFPFVIWAFGVHLPEISGTPFRLALFALGAALTGVTLVFDESTIGLMRGGVQLTRNLVMSVAKLVVLPVTAIVLHDEFGVGLVLAWVFGTAVSLVPSAIMIRRSGSRIFHRPDWGLLRRLIKVALAHNWLNLALATPPKLIPVLVTLVVSPSANGAFYIAWMLASFLFMVPVHLATVLFAIASAAPEMIAEKLRFVLRLSLMIGLPVMAILAIGAHFTLNIFGAGYAELATVPLWLLILAYLPGLPKAQYIAVCRATGRVSRAAVVLGAAACCELGAVVVGGKLGGLNGVCFVYLGVIVVEGIVTAPTVLRAAYAKGNQRRAVTGALSVLPASAVAAGPNLAESTYARSQQRSIAALLAIASATVSVPEDHTLDAATQVWRTGSLPVVKPGDGLAPRAATAAGAGAGAGQANQPVARHAAPRHRRMGYRTGQQAAVDALIALAARPTSEDDPPPGS